jgi:hypothetical protein
MFVSAITEPPRRWTVYMLSVYAVAINNSMGKGLLDWAEVQMGESIQGRCAAVLQVTFMQIINDKVIKGIYCPADWVTERHQGTGKGDEAQKMAESDLNGKPRSLWKVGGKHPFISVKEGRKAKEVLSALVRDKKIRVVGKAGVRVLVTESLHKLIRTIQQCDALMMSLTRPIQWNDISMDELDLTNLEHKKTLCLTGNRPYVWLFASPETVGTTPIANLTMEDQLNVHCATTVCILDPHDTRFQVGTWVFLAIQNLVNAGALLA